jgi:hypothetical protein
MAIRCHDEFTISNNLRINLILATCHEQELQVFATEGKNLVEFRNKFHNFRCSTKFYMNFYSFKLDLARLKLTDIPDSRYIYFIFLNPGID